MDESHRHNIEQSGCMDRVLFIKLKGKQNESMVKTGQIVLATWDTIFRKGNKAASGDWWCFLY